MTELPPTVEALSAAVNELGFELVDVEVSGSIARRVVKLRIDRHGGSEPGHGVTSDDCQRVSRDIERRLEALAAVGQTWRLEVSSPGIERRVRFVEHWRRYVGREVRLRARGVAGTPTAVIAAVPDATHVVLVMNGEAVTMPLEAIRDATLVVNWSALLGNREVGES